jgi:hypothetical protein
MTLATALEVQVATTDQRLQPLLEAAQRWIYEQDLALADIDSIMEQAGYLIYVYRGRLSAERLPASLRTPCELIAWARPESAQDDASLEQYANWFARWLVLCLPWDEDMQEAVLDEVASWARSDP